MALSLMSFREASVPTYLIKNMVSFYNCLKKIYLS